VVSTTGKHANLWKAAVARSVFLLSAEDKEWLRLMKGKPIGVDHVFWFATKDKSRWFSAHTAKPDRDNLDKMMLDTLRSAQILPSDDSFVSDGRIMKLWSPKSGVKTTIRSVYSKPSWVWGLSQKDQLDDIGAFEV
jgi:Holliday junction resolvase RusA-like endonuclease